MQKKYSTEKIIFYVSKGLVAALPLFFLPWTAPVLGMDNGNKLKLLWLIVPLLFFLSVIPALRSGKLRLKITPLDLPILVFLGLTALSALFSIDRFTSVFGANGNISEPLLAAAVMVLYYFFLTDHLETYKQALGYVKILIIDFALILTASALAFLAYQKGMIAYDSRPIDFLRNLVGSWEDFSVLIAVMTVIMLGGLHLGKRFKSIYISRREAAFMKVLLAASLITLVLIDFFAGWWCLLAGALFLLSADIWIFGRGTTAIESAAGAKKRRAWSFVKKYALLLFCILLCVNYLLNHYLVNQAADSERLAKKLQLDIAHTREVAMRSLGDRTLSGYGPDTFGYAASYFRDAGLNNSDFWHLRLERGTSFIFETAATTGVLGLAGYLFLLCSLFYFFARVASAVRRKTMDWGGETAGRSGIFLVLATAIVVLVTAQFVYTVNILLLFLFWLFVALLVVCGREIVRTKRIRSLSARFSELNVDAKRRYFAYQAAVIIVFFLFFGWVALLSTETKYGLAEFYFKKSRTEERPAALVTLQKSTFLNPHVSAYEIALARIYLNRALDRMNEGATSSLPAVRDDINNAIDRARKAIADAPRSVAARETLGMVYRDISRYSPDSRGLAIAAFKEAGKLEPTNPVIPAEIGKLYLDAGKAGDAIGYFRQAMDLKNDYYDAQLGLARSYEDAGMGEEAIKILERVGETNKNTDVYYELARLYFNQHDFNIAADYFNKVLAISPNHANALYGLALSYEAVGKNEEALYYLQKVSRLNPDNKEVNGKIEELK